ncbi:hypothetical protein [Actinomadura geliboluensis]|uniref:Thiolase N-terminal domain-containing protein n=1 Tax=Actinomadura geliboluensis TaxID=882440 RepID=A0A5S4H6N8_9ACTN|nr:hypothetical protein [Actinomadura geliboluensis]TMR40622.1 hypothetical protein ETD96_09710 [Actinomadura geliboluensis]
MVPCAKRRSSPRPGPPDRQGLPGGLQRRLRPRARRLWETSASSSWRARETAYRSATTAAAQVAGRFDAEIVPIAASSRRAGRHRPGQVSRVGRTVTADECVRPGTAAEGLSALRPVLADDRFHHSRPAWVVSSASHGRNQPG